MINGQARLSNPKGKNLEPGKETPPPPALCGGAGGRDSPPGTGYNRLGTMKILITADLHYDLPRSQEPTRALARTACAAGGDVLILAGDTAGADPAALTECLRLFAGFPGRKLLVAGNHCLWCRNGESSLDRYERLLPDRAAGCGFELLDHRPVAIDGLGLVGSVGWYDYSFREQSLAIPLAFYRAKLAPGAAAYSGEHAHLVEANRRRLTARQLAIATRWMDGVHVRLGMDDEAFLNRLVAKLRRHLWGLSEQVERIVAVTHHLPFEQLVPRGRPDRFAFAAAFMGSERLGQELARCPKVTDVYCGHSHWPRRMQIGRLRVVNVGSTYRDKRLEVLEVE